MDALSKVWGLDLWCKWWIDNTVQHIPPCCFLKIEDVQHLDRGIPLDEIEGSNMLEMDDLGSSAGQSTRLYFVIFVF